MVMKENQCGSTIANRRSEYFTRMHNAGTQTPNRYQDFAYQLVLGIEMQGKKMFFVRGEEPCSIPMIQLPAVGESLTGSKRHAACVPSQFQGKIKRSSLPLRKPSGIANLLHGRLCKPLSGSEMVQQTSRSGNGSLAPATMGKNRGQKIHDFGSHDKLRFTIYD
jgi:hypothetical protein